MGQSFDIKARTGFPGLDSALLNVRLGDNVVYQIDSMESYQLLVRKYVVSTWEDGFPVVYFRFASHAHLLEGLEAATPFSNLIRTPLVVSSEADNPLLAIGSSEQTFLDQDAERLPSLTVIELDPSQGFERFVRAIYQTATDFGLRTFYVFDCLSDLLVGWASDLMIGNFFQIICPYLFRLETVAYFSLIRGRHTEDTINRIRTTTQLLLNVYEDDQQLYIHPLKVWNRYSSTMFLPHRLSDMACVPLTNSSEVTSLYLRLGVDSIARDVQKDYWDRLFDEAKDLAIVELTKESSDRSAGLADESYKQMNEFNVTDQPKPARKRNIRSFNMKRRLMELLFGRRSQLNSLVDQYLTLADLVGIHRRQIGSGQIGGKAAGLLLARKILETTSDPSLIERMEPHDSFYLGSDIYYTYIVYNGWWPMYVNQKSEGGYYSEAAALQEKMLHGRFPEIFQQPFKRMLDYFGQAPIIVRSSSLLEDDYGHAFAGKYESVFCVNQGDPEERYRAFEQAIRCVYASTMDESALAYRKDMGLDQLDEQMALLVQRVSGDDHGNTFFPALAGVGYSKNIYIWHPDLDPDAGVIRLVYGLGTRAVDRSDGDYTRLVSLDHPFLTPNHDDQDERKYVQRFVDLLNLERNQLDTIPLSDLMNSVSPPDLRLFAEPDHTGNLVLKSLGIKNRDNWILNFKRILSQRQFIDDFQQVLKALNKAYDYPVDIEFTVNFQTNGSYRLNILQCRPLQIKANLSQIDLPENISNEKVMIESKGDFMGGSVHIKIDYVIYIIAETYDKLTQQDRYQVARTIGRLNRALSESGEPKVLLVGPGRWGTTSPSLGIPVRFSEINRMAALAEYAFESAGMRPELSFGSHFFQDLVEADIFYLSIDGTRPHVKMDVKEILARPNLLTSLVPDASRLAAIMHVSSFQGAGLILHSDIKSAKLLCYLS